MRSLLRFGFAAAIGVALGTTASAQTNGDTGTTNGGGTNGGGGTGGGGGGGTGQALGQVLEFMTPTSLDQSLGNQIGASSLNQSNILGRYYASPMWQGRAGAQTGELPGGFGQPLYGTTTGTTGGRTAGSSFGNTGGRTTTGTGFGGTTGGRTSTGTGFGGTTTGFGGATTGFGGAGGRTGTGGATGFGGTTGLGGARTGLGGLGGTGGLGRTGLGGFGGTGMTNTAQVVPLSRQINYTATLRIPQSAPAAVASRMQTEVRAVIDRSSSIANPAGVQVATDGPVVVLRGAARDEDEARLIENMIRLTPGVRDVRNELQFPGEQPQP